MSVHLSTLYLITVFIVAYMGRSHADIMDDGFASANLNKENPGRYSRIIGPGISQD